MSGADELIAYSLAYRSGPDIKALFDFIRSARDVSPASALRLYVQNPSLIFARDAGWWERRFGRKVRPGSRPYILPGLNGEPRFVFDVVDTDPINPADDRLPARVHTLAPAKGEPPPEMLSNTIFYCFRNRIEIVLKPVTDPQAAQIKRMDDPRWDFQVTVDPKASPAQKTATIAQELARIFCGHLGLVDDGRWIEHRTPSNRTQAFEAEAVAHLVTERLLLDLGTTSYLSNFFEGKEVIPEYSLDTVLQATYKIENLLRRVHPYLSPLQIKRVDHG